MIVFNLDDEAFSHQVAPMNVARAYHSSTVAGRNLFVFGGQDFMSSALASIEWCNPQNTPEEVCWNIVNTWSFTVRANSAFCAISKTEIMIAGGSRNDETSAEIMVFHTKIKMATKFKDGSNL